jgi:hypothetical protein
MYKLIEGKELPKEFKIKVNNEKIDFLIDYLISIGKKFGNKTEYQDKPYLYCYNNGIVNYGESKINWKSHSLPQIKFKDYFEKVELVKHNSLHGEELYTIKDSFPEKWCILVTDDNYKELNTWMHRNWGKYEDYTDRWEVKPSTIDYMPYFFVSCAKMGKGHCVFQTNDYKLITTEQFRQKFGDLKPKDFDPRKVVIFSKENDVLYHEIEMLKKDNARLESENYQFSKYNEDLTNQVGTYYKEVLMLTEKLETIKKVLE